MPSAKRYDNEDGLPSDEEGRAYQLARGPGDGRLVRAEHPPMSHDPVPAKEAEQTDVAQPEPADADMEETTPCDQASRVVFESAGDSHPPLQLIRLAAATTMTARVVFVSAADLCAHVGHAHYGSMPAAQHWPPCINEASTAASVLRGSRGSRLRVPGGGIRGRCQTIRGPDRHGAGREGDMPFGSSAPQRP